MASRSDIVDDAIGRQALTQAPSVYFSDDFNAQAPWSETVACHVDWLMRGPIRLPGGLTAAWVDDRDCPAYAYPEAAGYALTLMGFLYRLSGDDRYRQEARRWASALLADSEPGRPVGRAGIGYLFDTAVVMRGLGVFEEMSVDVDDPLVPQARNARREYARLAARWIAERRAWDGMDRTDRWSQRFTWHILKAIQHLAQHAAEGADAGILRERAAELIVGLDSALDPVAGIQSEKAYLHAYIYGLEGLVSWRVSPPAGAAAVVERGAGLLARIQRSDGGIPRWRPGEGDAAVDATAQAARIWQCVDRRAFREPIQRALRFMERFADPRGGVYYSPTRNHRNAWTTVFAIQAMIWRDREPEPAWIL